MKLKVNKRTENVLNKMNIQNESEQDLLSLSMLTGIPFDSSLVNPLHVMPYESFSQERLNTILKHKKISRQQWVDRLLVAATKAMPEIDAAYVISKLIAANSVHECPNYEVSALDSIKVPGFFALLANAKHFHKLHGTRKSWYDFVYGIPSLGCWVICHRGLSLIQDAVEQAQKIESYKRSEDQDFLIQYRMGYNRVQEIIKHHRIQAQREFRIGWLANHY